MSAARFERYADRTQLVACAYEYVESTRSGAPSHTVESGHMRNTPYRFASHKLGHTTVALESAEKYRYAIQLEYARDVIEYWDQLAGRARHRGRRGPRPARDVLPGSPGVAQEPRASSAGQDARTVP